MGYINLVVLGVLEVGMGSYVATYAMLSCEPACGQIGIAHAVFRAPEMGESP